MTRSVRETYCTRDGCRKRFYDCFKLLVLLFVFTQVAVFVCESYSKNRHKSSQDQATDSVGPGPVEALLNGLVWPRTFHLPRPVCCKAYEAAAPTKQSSSDRNRHPGMLTCPNKTHRPNTCLTNVQRPSKSETTTTTTPSTSFFLPCIGMDCYPGLSFIPSGTRRGQFVVVAMPGSTTLMIAGQDRSKPSKPTNSQAMTFGMHHHPQIHKNRK